MRALVAHLPAAAPCATGVAVAVRHEGRERLLVGGVTDRGGRYPVTGRTRFEIGSLTKTFTGLLLAEMAARGEVDPADPVRRHLPPGAAPGLGRAVTLESLATHTSGLPRLPPGLLLRALARVRTNPYQGFGPDRVAGALRRTRPRPAGRYRYSNYGVALLGLALAGAAGRPYEELLTARVLRPLGLADTGFTPHPQVTGYLRGRPRPPWEMVGLAAAGGLRSSATDLLRHLTAHLSPPAGSLRTALAEVVRPRVSAGDHDVCLVWDVRRRSGRDLLFHSGGTRGCTAFVAFSPQTGTAFAALANAGPTVESTFVQRSYEAAWNLVERADVDSAPVWPAEHAPDWPENTPTGPPGREPAC
ncbi:serine hydrolase domain-containing protein [Actinosynnema sp. NPDC050436]|uniref:serine hydrolase domain-containing protein n=1 Tax=Actinosynnema sp. NPDC050436 TaxID=3155659 RepID=UPI0033DE52EB